MWREPKTGEDIKTFGTDLRAEQDDGDDLQSHAGGVAQRGLPALADGAGPVRLCGGSTGRLATTPDILDPALPTDLFE